MTPRLTSCRSSKGDALRSGVLNLELADIAADLATTNPLPLVGIVPAGVGSTESFLQLRTESGGSITIDSITLQ